MKNLIVLTFSCFVIHIALGQKNNQANPTEIWRQLYAENTPNRVAQVKQLHNGNLAVIGTHAAMGKNGSLLIINEMGERVAFKSLGGKKEDRLHAIVQMDEQTLMLCGDSKSFTNKALNLKKRNAWLLKASVNGEKQWEKVYGEAEDDTFKDVIYTTDRHLVAVGSKGGNLWVVKLNLQGDTVWTKTFQTAKNAIGHAVIQTSDNHLVITGTTENIRKNKKDAFLLKMDLNGAVLWEKTYGGRQMESAFEVTETYDGGLAFIGNSQSHNKMVDQDIWLVKLDANGTVLWERTYGNIKGNIGIDFGQSFYETADAGFLIGGHTFTHKQGAQIAIGWLFKTNWAGDVEWEKIHGGKKTDKLTSVIQLKKGDYLVAGETASRGNQQQMEVMQLQGIPIGQPDITWLQPKNIEDTLVKYESDSITLNMVFQVKSGVFLKKNNFQLYINGRLKKGKAYQNNFVLPPPLRAQHKFVYNYENLIPLKKGDTLVEIRLKTNYFDTKTQPLNIKYIEPPFLLINWVEKPKISSTGSSVPIKLMAFSNQPLKRQHFKLYLNGKVQDGGKYGSTLLSASFGKKRKKKKKQNNYFYLKNVNLKKGINKIKVQVNNGQLNEESDVMTLNYQPPADNDNDSNDPVKRKPPVFEPGASSLHIVSIGPAHADLQFTTKDARDLSLAYQQLGKRSKSIFSDIQTEELIGEKASAAEIKKTIEFYKAKFASNVINPQDVLVIFISSHGFLHKEQLKVGDTQFDIEQFRIQGSDFTQAAPKSTSVAYEDIILDLLAIQCNKIILIDACFSGGAAVGRQKRQIPDSLKTGNSNINRIITQISHDQPNLATITSSNNTELSYEDEKWQNGAFTEAILLGLDGSADINEDKQITIQELYDFIRIEVPSMVRRAKRQSQNPMIYSTLGDIPIFEY